MLLIKDLGMVENKSGNKYRMGIYECPSCKSVAELCTHNVKNQLKKAKNSNKDATCHNCMLIKRNTTHGSSNKVAFHKWRMMIYRCNNPKFPNYKRWGGRGISVCEEWLNSFDKFESWFLEQDYKENYELDRIDNNGNYSPQNCRLVPKYKNSRNREDKAEKHSKYRYVMWNKNNCKWQVNVPIRDKKGKRKYLGLFECEEKAQKAIENFYFDNDLNGLIK